MVSSQTKLRRLCIIEKVLLQDSRFFPVGGEGVVSLVAGIDDSLYPDVDGGEGGPVVAEKGGTVGDFDAHAGKFHKFCNQLFIGNIFYFFQQVRMFSDEMSRFVDIGCPVAQGAVSEVVQG